MKKMNVNINFDIMLDDEDYLYRSIKRMLNDYGSPSNVKVNVKETSNVEYDYLDDAYVVLGYSSVSEEIVTSCKWIVVKTDGKYLNNIYSFNNYTSDEGLQIKYVNYSETSVNIFNGKDDLSDMLKCLFNHNVKLCRVKITRQPMDIKGKLGEELYYVDFEIVEDDNDIFKLLRKEIFNDEFRHNLYTMYNRGFSTQFNIRSISDKVLKRILYDVSTVKAYSSLKRCIDVVLQHHFRIMRREKYNNDFYESSMIFITSTSNIEKVIYYMMSKIKHRDLSERLSNHLYNYGDMMSDEFKFNVMKYLGVIDDEDIQLLNSKDTNDFIVNLLSVWTQIHTDCRHSYSYKYTYLRNILKTINNVQFIRDLEDLNKEDRELVLHLIRKRISKLSYNTDLYYALRHIHTFYLEDKQRDWWFIDLITTSILEGIEQGSNVNKTTLKSLVKKDISMRVKCSDIDGAIEHDIFSTNLSKYRNIKVAVMANKLGR